MDKVKQYYITNSVRIKSEEIFQKNESILSFDAEIGFQGFLKESYKKLGVNYPKYHKMDSLCKLGILGSHVLLKDQKLTPDTALVFSNASSSHDIDRKHEQSLKNIVSPSVFVYTLPNIVLGEISIKYNLLSENTFFIEDKFNAELLVDYSEVLLNSGKTSSVVCGWIELKNDEYDVFLCLISNRGESSFTQENLDELYGIENE